MGLIALAKKKEEQLKNAKEKVEPKREEIKHDLKKKGPNFEAAKELFLNKKISWLAYAFAFLFVLFLFYLYIDKITPIAIGVGSGLVLLLLILFLKSGGKYKKSRVEEKIQNDKIIIEIKHELAKKGYKTEFDNLLDFLNKYGKLTLTQISFGFGVDQAKAESWCKILSDANLAELYYPAIGETELRKKEMQKEVQNA
ncbi:hypothetical protein HYX19_04055 [Candidatus Woesearchaeota archaeon]|nr:hypothetical protein [Candidatus Woesearchaeota archaeon]